MSLPTKLSAYTDCLDLYSLAAADPRGYRLSFPTLSAARTFQLRMNMARTILRDQSKRALPHDHPRYDTSEYDFLAARLISHPDADGRYWIYVEPHAQADISRVAEPIPADDPIYRGAPTAAFLELAGPPTLTLPAPDPDRLPGPEFDRLPDP